MYAQNSNRLWSFSLAFIAVTSSCSSGIIISDGAMKDALYKIPSMRLFAKLSLDLAIPDRITIVNFRHLLGQHQLANSSIWSTSGFLRLAS